VVSKSCQEKNAIGESFCASASGERRVACGVAVRRRNEAFN
jgi:hypothetical protein